jgi:dTDP-4-amino-4,6-dideoxygalactose transaminase
MSSRVPLLDLKAQFATIRTSVEAAIARVSESQVFILGPEVDALEREVAQYCGAKFAVGVGSGTDAILCSLMALGVGPGDEVLTSPYTFIATASCIARLGATCTFVDIEPDTFNIDASQLERKVTRRTKAIVPVHLFGQMADMRSIMDVAERHGIPVVEDAAQAIGAERNGHRAGSVGTLGCLSFFPSKNLGAFGDAGMVLSNDDALAASVRVLRNQGQEPKYFAQQIGGNFRMDALQAAVLRAKLPHLDGWTEARQRNAATYRRLFSEAGFDDERKSSGADEDILLPRERANVRHVYNQFVIRARGRDALRAYLAGQGIASEVYYPQPIHLQACFAAWGHCAGDYPQAERAASESLAIPIYAELSPSMQEAVVSSIAQFASPTHG